MVQNDRTIYRAFGQQTQHFPAFSGYLEHSQTAKQKLVQLQIPKKQCLFAKLTIHNLTSSSHCVGETLWGSFSQLPLLSCANFLHE